MIDPNLAPDLNTVKKIIEELDSLDHKKATIEDLRIYINKITTGYGVYAYYFNHGLVLFRGVLYPQKPTSFEHLIYPLLNKTKINRASDVGEQMFYSSTSRKAVLYELFAKPGDRLVISIWKTNNVLFFNNVGYTKANFEALSSKRIPRDLPGVSIGNSPFVAEYLAKSFCQPISEENNDMYKMTIAIARVHLQNVIGNKFSGLFYPTVQMNAEDENFAIIKETIDHGLLDLERVEFIEIIDKKENRYQYKVIDVADGMRGNTIDWKNLNKSWTVYDDSDELFIVKESGQFIAYNENGDIVDAD